VKPAYITCIKDEEDLIFDNLIYHYNLGIRYFFVMFNNSNSKTIYKVMKFNEIKKDAYVKVIYDNDIAYRQPERMKRMSEMAYSLGCDWIIPIDADEILIIRKYKTIQDYLKDFDCFDYGFVNCRWFDYHPHPAAEDGNYFLNWEYREKKPRPPSKIIAKWHSRMKFGDGHHIITSQRKLIANSRVAFYAHFPWRNYEQMRNKIINIGKAFIGYFGEDSNRPQINQYKKFIAEGDDYIKKIWNNKVKYRLENINNMIYDPLDLNMFKLH
jgi:hypothetical protein